MIVTIETVGATSEWLFAEGAAVAVGANLAEAHPFLYALSQAGGYAVGNAVGQLAPMGFGLQEKRSPIRPPSRCQCRC